MPVCDLSVTKTADPDFIVPGPTPGCDGTKENKIDIASLTFMYTGGGCGASANDQGDKAECSGSLTASLDALVTAAGGKDANKPYPVDPTPPVAVAPAGEFTITPAAGKDGPKDKLEAESTIELATANGTETCGIR